MTTVEFTQVGRLLRLKADGHAGWGESGHDLICAAESMLAYTLLENLRQAEQKGWLEEMDADIWDGGMFAEAVPRPDSRIRVYTIYRTVLTGYRLLAEQYPENVQIERKLGDEGTRGDKFSGLVYSSDRGET